MSFPDGQQEAFRDAHEPSRAWPPTLGEISTPISPPPLAAITMWG